ncbi:MAG TPA: NADH-quinone oxidoreductase subunit NuoG [Abditibacteriaceae bacterium]|nr:NADH-quinone oxidoreductase subunit NuoG [Abditibacteriaceae bacterium]
MPELVNITIDGQKIQVPKGALAIEAATQLGIDVPRFCYHPKLSAVGMCRMCLGEVGMPKMNPDRTPALNEDGTPQIAMMPKPQTLCTTQAAEGMMVLTETPPVIKMREAMLEFLLANHPLDCPVCDKGGECMLQDQTMAYANGLSRIQDLYHLRRDLAKDYPLSELITLDQERCIQCARCTRFCDEIAQDHVLDLCQRGSKTQIETLSDPPFDSKFSGNTIDICPVGALTSRAFRFRARVWELKNVPTVSMADGCGTNIFVSQRNETLVRVIPRDNEAVNECWISDRDRFGLHYVDTEARLTYPLVRRDGVLHPATWDEALQLVVDKIKAAGGAVGAVGGPKLTNEGALAMARFFREVAGTSNIDSNWTPKLTTPGKLPATFHEELEAADTILVIGSNPNEELPILDLRLKKAAFQRQAHLINCNPYKTALDRLAKQSLLYNEGSEVAIINGLAKLVHQSWVAEPAQTEMLRNNVEGRAGAQAWLDSLAPYSSSRVVESAGIDEAALRAAATAIAGAERLFLLIGEHASPAALAALQNLALLKGRSDYLAVLNAEANAVGVHRAGLAPAENGLDGAGILDAAATGKLEVLYIAAHNPLHHAADYETARRAVETVPFLVVQTLFRNALAGQADVVLPAASFLEQDGSTTNFHGKVQNLKQVFRPRERRDEDGNTLSACAPDWMIFTKLAQLCGADWGITQVQQWTQQFKALPVAAPAEAKFAAVADAATDGVLPAGTLRLITGALLYDGGESFPYCERLNRIVPEPFVHLHRADARRMSIENGALVEVKSTRTTVRVRARVGRIVKEGTVWMPRRLRDVQMNKIMDGKQPFTTVTIQKLEDAPVQQAEPAITHAAGPGQGAPVDLEISTAVVP